jgi:hypothetical protein
MSWRLDKDGAALWESMSPDDIACRDEELAWHDLNSRPWKLVNGLIEQSGAPTALAGGFAGLEVTPPVTTLAAATILGTEVALWTTPTYTPIAANPQCPKAYRLCSFGISTTAATQGTMAFNARFGQLITSPLLGGSVTTAQTASQTTTVFRLKGDMVIYRGGPATSGLVVGMFDYMQGTATTGGSTLLPGMSQMFGTGSGGQSVVTDGSVAAGLWIGGIAVTSVTNTFVPQGIIWSSWN